MEHPVDFETLQKKADRRTRIQKTVIYFFLTVWALIVLFPFYWMVSTSLKDLTEALQFPPTLIPKKIQW